MYGDSQNPRTERAKNIFQLRSVRRAHGLVTLRHSRELKLVIRISCCGVQRQLRYRRTAEGCVRRPLLRRRTVKWIRCTHINRECPWCDRSIAVFDGLLQIGRRSSAWNSFARITAKQEPHPVLLASGEHIQRRFRKDVSVNAKTQRWKLRLQVI